MTHSFAEIAFTPSVRALQEAQGSRAAYARLDHGPLDHDRLGAAEISFLGARDGFYMATVSETGWPYLQYRGGPRGFVQVLDERTLGFADLRGNRQYVSVGNLVTNDRVALFFMDYANRRRLKLLGRARIVGADEPALVERLAMAGAAGRVERGILIRVAAFDWNCPQHIVERWTRAELRAAAASEAAGLGVEADGSDPARGTEPERSPPLSAPGEVRAGRPSGGPGPARRA